MGINTSVYSSACFFFRCFNPILVSKSNIVKLSYQLWITVSLLADVRGPSFNCCNYILLILTPLQTPDSKQAHVSLLIMC